MLTRFINILLLSAIVMNCAADVFTAPSRDDDKLQTMCKAQLIRSYTIIREHKQHIPADTRQKVISLLLAAEIDGQLMHYPLCVNRLERVQFFLKRLKLDKKKPNITPSEKAVFK